MSDSTIDLDKLERLEREATKTSLPRGEESQ